MPDTDDARDVEALAHRVGAWRKALDPIIGKFKLARMLDQRACWEGAGAEPMEQLLGNIAGLLDRAVEAISGAEAAEARALAAERQGAEWQSEAEDLFDMKFQRDAADARAIAAEAERDALREALRPFAMLDFPTTQEAWEAFYRAPGRTWISFDDIAAARAALAADGHEEGMGA